MLAVENLHTYYGDSHILQGVNLEVNPGQVVALLGRNGAGKTTLMRSIIGWTPPRRGRVVYEGKDVARWDPFRIARLGIGISPQGRRTFPNLTVKENLLIGVRTPHEAAVGLQKVYQLFPRLKEREKHRASNLSGGEQSLLALGRALVTHPRRLLLDAPREGLAQFAGVVRHMRYAGVAVLLVEQNTALALSVANSVYILQKGQIAYQCEPEVLRNDRPLLQRYLSV